MLEHIIHGIVREAMEKKSLTSMAMYDAVPIPKITTLQVYTCDLNYEGGGKWLFYTGAIITKNLKRAQDHWGSDNAHLINLPTDTEIMWYDQEFGEISRFIVGGRSRDHIRFDKSEITKV